MSNDIEIKRDGGVQQIRFTRLDKKNALNAAMYAAMTEALVAGDADPEVSVHMFLGGDGCFTSGNDLNDFLAGAKGDASAAGGVVQFLRTLPDVSKPMLAAVDGAAVGIGVTLLFHCDLVYASERATFTTPFLDLGLVPENASSLLAPRLMGYQRAFELLVLGETFDAARAQEAGFVNGVVDRTEVESVAMAAAKRLAEKPPEALCISRALMRGDPREVRARSDAETAAFSERIKSPEAREAFTAFLEKRPPNFSKLRS